MAGNFAQKDIHSYIAAIQTAVNIGVLLLRPPAPSSNTVQARLTELSYTLTHSDSLSVC